MSGENDNLLARWSRRKLAARSGEAPAASKTEHEPGETAENPDAGRLQQPASETVAADLEPSEISEPLPSIEDLTAEGDLTAFLKKGVPMALKSAAMRKMWSLNPAIRDYVGPAEYAWDFNQPGSMAGFGPLDTKETVVSFLSRTVREIETGTDEPAAAPEAQPSADSEQHAAISSNSGPDTDAAEPAQAIEPIPFDSSEQPPSPPAQQLANARPTAGPANPSRAVAGPRHGSALPHWRGE